MSSIDSTTVVGALNSLERAVNQLISELREQRQPVLMCASCLSKKQQAEADLANGVLWDGDKPTVPEVRPAETVLPSWQTTAVAGQIMMQCVPLPCCLGCALHHEESAQERATKAGIILGQG